MAFGAPEWPPSPARVFQALVAGVARGVSIPDHVVRSLEWLEQLAPPMIGTPRSRPGARASLWVPNNDLDAKGGDPAKLAELRTAKVVFPRLIEGDEPLMYVWSWTEDVVHGAGLLEAAEQLYQLGRGVDLAWAHAEILDDDGVARVLGEYPGLVHKPAGPGDTSGSLCPVPGSLASLQRRFEARRIEEVWEGKKRKELFANAPKPLFQAVRYGRRSELIAFDILDASDERRAFPFALHRVASLVVAVRDAAAERLRDAFPHHHEEIARVLIGRRPDANEGSSIDDRVRIVPLPSIGHEHADLGVRRLLVDLPGGSSLSVDDLAWAFDGLGPADPTTGVLTYVLARAKSSRMPDRYIEGARCFRTVTPVVLPREVARRRIEPTRRQEEAKPGAERDQEQARAIGAVATALRHAGVRAHARDIVVQREPFDRRGARAERFADGTRFEKERMWHVQFSLDREVQGPLVIGDGRFLGLGVLAPRREPNAIHAFTIEDGLVEKAIAEDVARALRRAVMSLVQDAIGRRSLPSYFSGHDDLGAPAQDDVAPHLSFAFDPVGKRVLIVAPHVLSQRAASTWEQEHLSVLERALQSLHLLRAGRAGLLVLRNTPVGESDPIVCSSRRWRTISPYRVNRHAKKVSAKEAVALDVRAECARRGLPLPQITVHDARGRDGVGLVGDVELEFAHAVSGPVLLGRNRHVGGGMFAAIS